MKQKIDNGKDNHKEIRKDKEKRRELDSGKDYRKEMIKDNGNNTAKIKMKDGGQKPTSSRIVCKSMEWYTTHHLGTIHELMRSDRGAF